MSVTARFKSDAFEAIHASASAMLKVGTIDKATMCRFDEACLAVPVVARAKARFGSGLDMTTEQQLAQAGALIILYCLPILL